MTHSDRARKWLDELLGESGVPDSPLYASLAAQFAEVEAEMDGRSPAQMANRKLVRVQEARIALLEKQLSEWLTRPGGHILRTQQDRIALLESALAEIEKAAGDIADCSMIMGNEAMESARKTALELLRRIQTARAKVKP